MGNARTGCTLLLSSSLLVACAIEPGDYPDAERELGITQQALGPCNETVPANRFIDGIPAYAQCDVTRTAPSISNNGIDTSATKVGSDWVRTQFSGGYQCTELAHRYLHFKWKVSWMPNGNAGEWCDTQPPANSGVVQSTTPVHGDLIVFAPGSCGADATTDTSPWSTWSTAKGKVSVVEQNRAAAARTTRPAPSASCTWSPTTAAARAARHGAASRRRRAAAGAGGARGAGTREWFRGMAMPMVPSQPHSHRRGSRSPKPPVITPPAQPPSNAGAGGSVPPTMPAVSMAGAGGGAAAVPSQIPIPLDSGGDDAGCSVAHIGGTDPQRAGSGALLFAFALTALFTRAQRRRKP